MRVALFACAAVLCAAAAVPALATPDAATCTPSNLRIYFRDGSASLDRLARETLSVAQRQMASCNYAELHIAVDASNYTSRAQGEAVRAALNGRTWNVAALEPRAMTQRVSASPDYVEVTMTPEHLPVHELPAAQNPNIGA